MLERLRTYLLYGKQYASFEITSQGEQDIIFGVLASKKKEGFVGIESLAACPLAGLSGVVPKDTHGYLSITTDQILIKETGLREKDLDMFVEAFPGLKDGDFYYELFRTPEKAFIAIARKEYVDQLLEDFKKADIQILGFHLGFTKLQDIVPFVDNGLIATPRFLVSQTDGEIKTHTDNKALENGSYRVSDVDIDGNHILSLAGLSGYMENGGHTTSNTHSRNSDLSGLFIQKAIFKKGLIAASVFFLGTLLINAVLFTDYHNRLNGLEEENRIVVAQKERFSSKQQQIATKEQIVSNIMMSGSSKSVFYINRVAGSLPKSITLSLLEFQPLKKAIRPDKPISYESSTLVVEGRSWDKQGFNDWIGRLSTMDWVKGVDTHKYSEGSRAADFGISLTIADDTEE